MFTDYTSTVGGGVVTTFTTVRIFLPAEVEGNLLSVCADLHRLLLLRLVPLLRRNLLLLPLLSEENKHTDSYGYWKVLVVWLMG